jgi:hypothetical protein
MLYNGNVRLKALYKEPYEKTTGEKPRRERDL